jgi:hypothetical protein
MTSYLAQGYERWAIVKLTRSCFCLQENPAFQHRNRRLSGSDEMHPGYLQGGFQWPKHGVNMNFPTIEGLLMISMIDFQSVKPHG